MLRVLQDLEVDLGRKYYKAGKIKQSTYWNLKDIMTCDVIASDTSRWNCVTCSVMHIAKWHLIIVTLPFKTQSHFKSPTTNYVGGRKQKPQDSSVCKPPYYVFPSTSMLPTNFCLNLDWWIYLPLVHCDRTAAAVTRGTTATQTI